MFQACTISVFIFSIVLLMGCSQQSSKQHPEPVYNVQSCQSSTQKDFAALLEGSNSPAGHLANVSRDRIFQIHDTCVRFHQNWSNPTCRISPPASPQPFNADYQKVIRYCEEVEKYVQNLNKTPPSTPIAQFNNPKISDLNRYDRVKLTFKKRVRNYDPEFGNHLAMCYVDFNSRNLPEILEGAKATLIYVDLTRMHFEFIYDITAYLDTSGKVFSIFCRSRTANLRFKELEQVSAPVLDIRIP